MYLVVVVYVETVDKLINILVSFIFSIVIDVKKNIYLLITFMN